MAYDQHLADRIREKLAELPNLAEKEMFQGLTFLINEKLCICVSGDKLLCRFDPILHEEMAEKNGFEEMVVNGRVYRGYGYIQPEVLRSQRDLDFWIQLALAFNPRAKAAKKKK
ncbi:TfoX/Sxy family protein [Spirosoma foliorum]|uniref:TfoX/Sxy family protein n=1 Tax=Spirosoma foliorum TaxID=2710596 RepID=A0A7G5GZD1_9BACT|nr:TfoX/Sxy family protein [Spirosoma foliorum]QMW04223.1 TfoX/Sxy family protein [Spirosoma foliorum]